jgi:hypothetical protein
MEIAKAITLSGLSSACQRLCRSNQFYEKDYAGAQFLLKIIK